jgi:hypothetical protein
MWCLRFFRDFQLSRAARFKGVAVGPPRTSVGSSDRFARWRCEQPKADAKKHSDDRSGNNPDRGWEEQNAYWTPRGVGSAARQRDLGHHGRFSPMVSFVPETARALIEQET